MRRLESRLLGRIARRPSPDAPGDSAATPCPATRPTTRAQRLRRVASSQATPATPEKVARSRLADPAAAVGDRRRAGESAEPRFRANRWNPQWLTRGIGGFSGRIGSGFQRQRGRSGLSERRHANAGVSWDNHSRCRRRPGLTGIDALLQEGVGLRLRRRAADDQTPRQQAQQYPSMAYHRSLTMAGVLPTLLLCSPV